MDAIAGAAAVAALDSSALDRLGQRLRAIGVLLRELAAQVLGASPAGWTGAGERAYEAAASRAAGQLRAQAGGCEAAGVVLVALATTLRSVQEEAIRARRLAAAEPMTATSWQGPVNSQLQLAVAAFDDADRRAAAVVMDCLRGMPQLLTSGVVAMPVGLRAAELSRSSTRPRAMPTDPVAVALWWAGLPIATQRRLRSAGGGRSLAEVDGIPARIRDALNRSLLAAELRTAEQKYAAASHGVRRELAALTANLPWPFSKVSQYVDPGLQRWKLRLGGLRDLTRELRRPGSELLEFDPAGDGRAEVASGDIESGHNLAVLVPGMNSTLNNLTRTVKQSVALAGAAGAGTVVVAWLGYDAPNVVQVASDAKAKTGASALQRFTAGLRATAQQVQQVTLIGHSYGTLVAGLAARAVPVADDLVLLASPGIEAHSAGQLQVPAGHVFVARAGTDPIQVVFWPAKITQFLGLGSPQVFGPDPAAPAFGATRFSVDGAYGHSGYFSSGSQSLDNLARIVSGRSPTR